MNLCLVSSYKQFCLFLILENFSENTLNNIKPVDDWGLVSKEFRSIIKNEELLMCARDGGSVEFFHFDTKTFYENLLGLHRGISSDLFQVDGAGNFYQSKPCRVDEWSLTITKTIIAKHVYLANQLSETVKKLKKHFVNSSDNSIRLMMQKYLMNEQQIYWEYFETLLGTGADLRFQSIIE